MLIVGKQNFLQIVKNLLHSNNITRIFLNGIIDKELISLIKKQTQGIEEKLDFRIVLSHIHRDDLIIASYFLKFGEIRTNIKCKSRFILLDNHLFFLSGNNKNSPYYLDVGDFIIQLEENTVAYDLEKIFLKHWEKGMILYI